MNVDFTSDLPLDDTSGLAVSFGSKDVGAFVGPNDASNNLSEKSPNKTETSKVGQKRRLSTETPMDHDAAFGDKMPTPTPMDIDANASPQPNADEP